MNPLWFLLCWPTFGVGVLLGAVLARRAIAARLPPGTVQVIREGVTYTKRAA